MNQRHKIALQYKHGEGGWVNVCVKCGKVFPIEDAQFEPPIFFEKGKEMDSVLWCGQPNHYVPEMDCEQRVMDKNNAPFGDRIEAGLLSAELETNAKTWRHIWFVQRFMFHGIQDTLRTADRVPTIPYILMFNLTRSSTDDVCPLMNIIGDELLAKVWKNTVQWFRSIHENMPEGHIGSSNLVAVMSEIQRRAITHDQGKLTTPEVAIFTEFTPKLANTEYGSDEYNQFLSSMRSGLEVHYANNRHHPEHFDDGVFGMNLIDLYEMFCDWMASCLRNNKGDIKKSIEYGATRFGLSQGIVDLFLATYEHHFKDEHYRDPLEFIKQ